MSGRHCYIMDRYDIEGPKATRPIVLPIVKPTMSTATKAKATPECTASHLPSITSAATSQTLYDRYGYGCKAQKIYTQQEMRF